MNFKASKEKLIAILIPVFIFLEFSYTAVRFWNTFIEYVLHLRKISLPLKNNLPLHSKYFSWLCETKKNQVYLCGPLPFQRTSLTIIPSFFICKRISKSLWDDA